ncbi:hypothetical protein GW17_00051390 [Ensete ventricosum]|nr:hypothetical protein GW17_00051390 [Ensete ventricosum]
MSLDAALQRGMVVLVAAVVVVGVCTFSLEKMLATYAVGIVGIAGILLPDWEFFHQDFPQWFAFMRARRATAVAADACGSPASWRFVLLLLSTSPLRSAMTGYRDPPITVIEPTASAEDVMLFVILGMPNGPRADRGSTAADGMPRCPSFTVFRDRCHRRAFLAAGLRPSVTALADGATVHCWVPARPDPSRPPLLLLHGFGATAIWQWSAHLRPLLRAGFDLYVPDLLFFGVSAAPGPDRSESYQAQCIMAAMEAAGVRRFGLVGVSYGGFVAYRMAAMYPTAVERVVLCCAGVCLEERDLAAGLFVVSDLREAIEILLPQRPEKLRQLVRLSFVRPPPVMPSCFLRDYIQVGSAVTNVSAFSGITSRHRLIS